MKNDEAASTCQPWPRAIVGNVAALLQALYIAVAARSLSGAACAFGTPPWHAHAVCSCLSARASSGVHPQVPFLVEGFGSFDICMHSCMCNQHQLRDVRAPISSHRIASHRMQQLWSRASQPALPIMAWAAIRDAIYSASRLRDAVCRALRCAALHAPIYDGMAAASSHACAATLRACAPMPVGACMLVHAL